MRIGYLTNSAPSSGVGHRAVEIQKRLKARGVQIEEISLQKKGGRWPKSIQWILQGRKVRQQLRGFDLIEATNQTLSFVGGNGKPFVVSVHDIIEILEPQSNYFGKLLNWYLYSGITKADQIIAVSEYTAKTLQERYGITREKITVIYNGVGSAFHPIENFPATIGYQTLRQELQLHSHQHVILYVGSDHPRKNVVGAVRAFARAQKKFPNIIFVKVGEPGLPAGRAQLLQEVDHLGIREAVRFVGNVSLERLNELYNLADAFLYPSKFEGFGLPPLQAMAAGTPVITSNSSSLPEVVGDDADYGERAALVRDPDDITGMAEDVEKVLTDSRLSQILRKKGLERAKQFSWDKAARAVSGVYNRMLKT